MDLAAGLEATGGLLGTLDWDLVLVAGTLTDLEAGLAAAFGAGLAEIFTGWADGLGLGKDGLTTTAALLADFGLLVEAGLAPVLFDFALVDTFFWAVITYVGIAPRFSPA